MDLNNKILVPELLKNGLIQLQVDLPQKIKVLIEKKDYVALDSALGELVCKQGLLYKTLSNKAHFEEIEYITAIRTDPDEEGIWHDDGSRILGFTLGLNFKDQHIEGGELIFRVKGSNQVNSLSAPSYGTLTVFLTGLFGYEHKVTKVSKGFRLVMAGWCS